PNLFQIDDARMTSLVNPPIVHPPSAHRNPSGPASSCAARDNAVTALFRKQHADGHWCAELEGDSILCSEYLLMKAILGQHEVPQEQDKLRRIARYMHILQRPDGTWGQYPGSPPDLSACVKAYFALKLFGHNPDAPHMKLARERILEMGGADGI